MSSPSPDLSADRRELRLRLRARSAVASTILTLSTPRRALDLDVGYDGVEVRTEGVGSCRLDDHVARLRHLRAGARVFVSGQVRYRVSPHGLSRWIDPSDGRAYVIGSGALGGASHFMACGDGPADRMTTTVAVEAPGVVRTGNWTGPLASHHLGLAAGPWRVTRSARNELLTRRSLVRTDLLETLHLDTRLVLDWVADWFGVSADGGPWGPTYTQVLLPRAPWLAMEHPGCVLLSERLLDAPRTRRVAVLAHEVAHQWLGNLVSPRTWADVGVFEGLAELLGQLACQAIVGPDSAAYLARRRGGGPLWLLSTGPDLRTLAPTAGLAEVAGPVQHAELFRRVRTRLGVTEFRERIRDLVRRHEHATCGRVEVWDALGRPPAAPPTVRLPTLTATGLAPSWPQLKGLEDVDPATAAAAARQMFRSCAPGPWRVRAALVAMADPATSHPVVAGLAAEMSRQRMQ